MSDEESKELTKKFVGLDLNEYNLEGHPSQFLAIWKRKMIDAGFPSKDWDKFFAFLQADITGIGFTHRRKFVPGPNGTRSYYNDDGITYTCRGGETMHVSYGSLAYAGGTMWDDDNPTRTQDEWKFAAYLWMGFGKMQFSAIREAAKADFFASLVGLETRYHLGLFLLTFEHILLCSTNSRMAKDCKHLCKNICTSCVIL